MRKFERIVALVLVFILVIATNVMDDTSFKVVKESMGNIYEDRLIAYDLTYKMHNEVSNRHLVLANNNVQMQSATLTKFNTLIANALAQYEATEFTTTEQAYFEILKSQFNDLQALDGEILAATTDEVKTKLLASSKEKLSSIVGTLNSLATIQIDEGKRQVINSDRAIKSSDMLSKFEIISMVVIGLLILFLIIYEPKI